MECGYCPLMSCSGAWLYYWQSSVLAQGAVFEPSDCTFTGSRTEEIRLPCVNDSTLFT